MKDWYFLVLLGMRGNFDGALKRVRSSGSSVPPSCPVGSELWSLIDWNAHLLAVVTDVVQPLLPRSYLWTTTVCVSIQKQMWIVVTSRAGKDLRRCHTFTKVLLHIYLKNNPAKFHPDPIWNGRALGFFEDGHPKKKNKNEDKMSSNIKSVPDPKIIRTFFTCVNFLAYNE